MGLETGDGQEQSDSVVSQLPLTTLVLDGLPLVRQADLDRRELEALVQLDADTQLVVADLGKPLRVFSGERARQFWEREGASRVSSSSQRVAPEGLTWESYYSASFWGSPGSRVRVVVLERQQEHRGKAQRWRRRMVVAGVALSQAVAMGLTVRYWAQSSSNGLVMNVPLAYVTYSVVALFWVAVVALAVWVVAQRFRST